MAKDTLVETLLAALDTPKYAVAGTAIASDGAEIEFELQVLTLKNKEGDFERVNVPVHRYSEEVFKVLAV